MRYRLNSEKGSLSLTTMFSSASGVLFVLLFYNLSTYVGSLGAINETARATARCITPTDPACVTVLSSAADGVEFDWYARTPEQSISTDVSVRTFRYQASMPSDLWGARFSYYRTNIGDQNFSLNYSLVPVKTFYAKGGYEIPQGVISASYRVQGSSEFKPKYNPNFPLFEQDRSLDRDDWLTLHSPYEFIAKESGEVAIRSDDNYEYTTPFITVPTISAENGAKCTGDCSTHLLAGGIYASWKDRAYVAIKAISRVRAEKGQTTLKWGQTDGLAGLEVEIKDAQGNTINWNPEGTNQNYSWRCLGGAEETGAVGTSWRGYNLWLRGPKGANGGPSGSSVCPGGIVNHDAIQVPRGGSYRIRARLTNTGSNTARARITILSFYDEYTNTTPVNKIVECAALPYSGFDQEQASCALESCVPTNCKNSYCPNQNLKSLSVAGLAKVELLSCASQRQSVSFSCTENEKTIPNSAKTMQTASLAICNANWTPPISPAGANSRETICAWQSDATYSRWQEVGSTNCELAQAANISESCENPFVETTPGASSSANLSKCNKLNDKLKQLKEATEDLNTAQNLGAPKFNTNAIYKFGALTNIKSANFWTNKDLQGNPLPQTTEIINTSLSTAQAKRFFVKSDNSTTTPKALDFLSDVKDSGIQAYGWENFEQQASSLIRPEKLAREDFSISSVYPFNEQTTEEIYYGQIDPSAGWDFQADCTVDTSCNCKADDSSCSFKTHDNLERLLREHASAEIPYASDTSFKFNFSATHVGYKEVGKFQPGSLPELPTCYPTRAVCSKQKSANDALQYLGRSKIKPQECNNYASCFSKLPDGVDFNVGEGIENIDLNLARQAGLKELRKIAPYATIQEECGVNPGCAEIDIDTSSGSRAIVKVRYNMPLSFPLSGILQRDSVQLAYTKEEVIERDFAGSNFYK